MQRRLVLALDIWKSKVTLETSQSVITRLFLHVEKMVQYSLHHFKCPSCIIQAQGPSTSYELSMKLKTIESTLPWNSSPRWSKKAFFTLLHLRLSVLVPFSSPPPMQKVNLAHRVKLLGVDPPSLSALLGKGGTCEAYHDPKNHFAHFAYGCRTCIKRK